jgi:hypothetical protein
MLIWSRFEQITNRKGEVGGDGGDKDEDESDGVVG